MHTLLLLGLFVLPTVGGLALIARHILSPDRDETRMRWAVALTAGIAAFCAVALRFMGGDAALALRWLPGTGPMTLSLGSTSLLAAAATAAALGVTAAVVEPTSSLVCGTGLLALASGNVAFLAGHFLLRYGALELVGLFIAAAPLLQVRDRGERTFAAGVHAAWVYLLLRLGDAGLLTAILVLWTHTGTLEITPALEAGAALPIGVQAWVAGGFLLAVAVKIGLWPFHGWVHSEGRLDRLTGTWLYATLMPNLGLYLLYRVTPLVSAAPGLRWGAIGAGIVAGGAALFPVLARSRRIGSPARILAGIGTVLWCAAVAFHARIAWWGLLILSLARLPLFLRRTAAVKLDGRAALGDRIRRFARWLQVDVQEGVLERGLGTVAGGLDGVAGWLHDHVERDVLERGLTESAEKTLIGAKQLHEKVEQDGLEGGLREVVHTALHASHHLRLWHGGKLRVNLVWVVLSLVVATVVALIV